MNSYNITSKLPLTRISFQFTRYLRGYGRGKRLQDLRTMPPPSPSSTVGSNLPKSQLAQNPLNKPEPSQMLGKQALIGLTENKLAELARSSPPLMFESQVSQKESASAPLKESASASLKVEPAVVEPVTADNQHERIADCVTPLWRLRYAAQLEQKQLRVLEVLKTLKRRLKEVNAPPLLAPQPGLPCPVQAIIPSPELLQYRSKDEFVVYRGVDGDPKTVGFLTGHPKLPHTVCVPPTHIISIRDKHKLLCQHFQRFIRQSDHPTCLHFADSCGVWRSIVARSNGSGDLMAVVIVHPWTLTQDQLTELEEALKQYFFHSEGAECGVTSLYLQVCPKTRCIREEAPYKLLQGSRYITQSCSGVDFQISPDTFFQINNSAAERLYACVGEVAELSPLTTLLDVCCGTGSISLLLAGRVRGCVGVEEVTAAVEDANNNARHNNITNTTFIAGPAEQVLPRLVSELGGCSDVVAVVNPGRSGLSPKVISSLRDNLAISKLLYLSCRPEGYALSNFVSLGNMLRRSKKKAWTTDLAPPLLPKYAFSVDMFPHTDHYELGVLFERVRN